MRSPIPLPGLPKGPGIRLALAGAFALVSCGQDSASPEMFYQHIYQSIVDSLPKTVGLYKDEKPNLPYEIQNSFAYLKATCPALEKIGTKHSWNVSNWLNGKVSEDEWKVAPYKFRMQAFRAAAVQKNTDVKTDLLTKLRRAIDYDPNFMIWVDNGMDNFNKALKHDRFIAAEMANWPNVVKDDNRLKKYFSHLNALYVASFLPHTKVDLPEIIISHEPSEWIGLYKSDKNTISYNFSTGSGLADSANYGNRITAHESFHVVESIIKNWYLDPAIIKSSMMADIGEKVFYESGTDLAYIPLKVNAEAYSQNFKERLSYYAMNINNPDALETRKPEWRDSHSLRNNEFDNPDRGTIPKACFN